MPNNDPRNNLSETYFADLLGTTIVSVEKLSGGNNSRAFKVTAADKSVYFSKLYPGPTADGQSRMSTEYKALEFLHKRKIDCVPKPITMDSGRQCGVYEFVPGSKLISSRITTVDIDQATRFLRLLDKVKDDPESLSIPKAAEACFSFQAIVDNLEARLTQLYDIHESSPYKAELTKFLENQFLPTLEKVLAWCQKRVTDTSKSMYEETAPKTRTLSPSDFGFHNCLRRSDGELIFLDFEYFGWDDPAKMICDFLLHPAMGLSYNLKERFVERLINTSNSKRGLAERVEIAYPLFGLKWCMIILNPFLPWHRVQREIPSGNKTDKDGLLEQQLEKANLMLKMVERGYKRFPYQGALFGINDN